ncbi:MAG: hypothetical protein H6672_16835 [Anaerolineaceae bacterium]|nr:hypothetical protein [Anaerolineaceae bacterium]
MTIIKRIEFTLNLDDPREAAIYRALQPALRYRRAGAIIRQALDTLLVSSDSSPKSPFSTRQETHHE